MRKFISPRSFGFVPVFFLLVLASSNAFSQQWTFAAGFGTNTTVAEAVQAVCTDASGNLYATGKFNTSINFGGSSSPLTANAIGTRTDGFVAKFNPAGTCQWAIRFGGNAADGGGFGIATDGIAVYVTGQSQFPSTVGSTAISTVGGSIDGIVFSLNAATGATNWAKAFGGIGTTDRGQAACLDPSGNLYISGIFNTRTSNPTASFGAVGSFPRTVQGNISQATTDLFVAQINSSTGIFNWVSTGGAASQETPLIIANDNLTGSGIAYASALNELIVTGSFSNANASYFSNCSAIEDVSLANAGVADICVL
jgi:trimeric autotransporter adhesin